jgi:hypothetical protein
MVADCAGRTETTLTGTVYDPAGNLGLFDVFVYVPNKTPDPITPGNPTCSPCEAPASGDPVIGTLTDPTGKFTLTKGPNDPWGVPTGKNIPLVLQAGKWRRQLVIPQVDACAPVDLDTLLGKDKLRLPRNGTEGDMPLIAFTSGCDPAECFLRHVGIDAGEFVAPGGNGHVHFYTGRDDQTSTSASSVAGGNTFAQTYQWWTNQANLLKYDIVFNSCECNENDRGMPAYPAMDAYLNGGGRLFATHYYYNWFTNLGSTPGGTPDLMSVAQWSPGGPQNTSGTEADAVDMSFPKGMAFAQWLDFNKISTSLGNISLSDTRDDITAAAPAGCNANMSCLSTQWIVHPGDNHPRYLSFNAPVGLPTDKQCGRAVFSDVHLSGQSNDAVFPAECDMNPTIDTPAGHKVNEQALEFLFFDLSSCVQNDRAPPVLPPQ